MILHEICSICDVHSRSICFCQDDVYFCLFQVFSQTLFNSFVSHTASELQVGLFCHINVENINRNPPLSFKKPSLSEQSVTLKSICRTPFSEGNTVLLSLKWDFESKQNTSQVLPIGEGAASLYLIPILCYAAHAASTSLDTHLSSPGCFALHATSRSRHGFCFCVQRVVLMETNGWSSWDKFFSWLMERRLGFSLLFSFLIVTAASHYPQPNLR